MGKITDAEIKKALEICNSLHIRCGNGCPYYEVPYKNGKRCSEMMIDDTLDLIKRKDAVIAELQRKNNELEIELKVMRGAANSYKTEIERFKSLDIQVEVSKKIEAEIISEAIKEFVEKLKAMARNYYPSIDHYCCSQKVVAMIDIDNLAEEYCATKHNRSVSLIDGHIEGRTDAE